VSGPVVEPHRNLSLLLDHLVHKFKLLHTAILTTNNSRLAILNNSDQSDRSRIQRPPVEYAVDEGRAADCRLRMSCGVDLPPTSRFSKGQGKILLFESNFDE
jgi:hypothetical protein